MDIKTKQRIDSIIQFIFEQFIEEFYDNPFLIQYVLWMESDTYFYDKKHLITILMTKPYLFHFSKIIATLKNHPIISISNKSEPTICDIFNDDTNIAYYSIFKFIGQYCDDENTFKTCYDMLDELEVDNTFLSTNILKNLFSLNFHFANLKTKNKTPIFENTDTDIFIDSSIYLTKQNYNDEDKTIKRFVINCLFHFCSINPNDDESFILLLNEIYQNRYITDQESGLNFSLFIPNCNNDMLKKIELCNSILYNGSHFSQKLIDKLVKMYIKICKSDHK